MKSFGIFLALALCAFLATEAHVAVIGSRGPASHNPDYFKADAQSPCPGEVIEDNRYDVLAGTVLPITWSLWVNHNVPPQPVGTIYFNLFLGNATDAPQTNVGLVPVTNQPQLTHFVQNVIVPSDYSGDATIQIYYDVNGGASPFPAYYQCIDLNVIED